MSTRSTISYVETDGTVFEVYCHHDGYLEYNGKILQESYCDIGKLRLLISNGIMSGLEPNVKDCEFYRARGESEEETSANMYSSLEEYMNDTSSREAYNYIYSDNKWLVNRPRDGSRFVELKPLIENI